MSPTLPSPLDRVKRTLSWSTISRSLRLRSVGYVSAALLLAALVLLWWPYQSDYKVRVTATVSHGRVLELFFNDFQEVPLRTVIVPGVRTVYELAPWPHPITRLRLDPTETPGSTVSLEAVEVLSGDTVVSRFRAVDLAAWASGGVRPLAADTQRLTVEITNDDPVFVSRALSIRSPRGLLDQAPLQSVALLAGLLLVTHVVLRHGRPAGDVGSRQNMHVGESSWWLIGTIGLVALRFVYVRGHDQNWDLLSGHYFHGYWFLHGRFTVDVAPANLGSFVNPLASVPAYVALAFLPFPASAWLLTGMQLLALPILAFICHDIGRDLGHERPSIAEVSALSLCLVAPLWWSELGTAFTESFITPLVLLGLLQGLRGAGRVGTSRSANTPLVFSGLAFGLATGLKLTNAVFAVAFLIALTPTSLVNRARALRGGLVFAAALAAGFATTAWWNVYLAWQWGSPLFPFYNALFRSPYYPPTNFDDSRWGFHSASEFLQFLPAAVLGTGTTSEMRFADARLLVFAELFVVACVVRLFSAEKRRSVGVGGPIGKVFVTFFAVSLAVWAILFGYQRYLLPIEVLFGVAIWILLAWTFGERKSAAALLVICTLGSFTALSVPDWKHRLPTDNPRDVFGLKLPAGLAARPADYLVFGSPISYILPFLHPGSRFLSIDFPRPQVDAMTRRVRSELERDRSRPVRLLTREASLEEARVQTRRFGYVPGDWRCQHFASDTERYVACEVGPDGGQTGQARGHDDPRKKP